LDAVLRTGEAENEESGVTNALIRDGLIGNPLRKIISVPLSEAIVGKQEAREPREGRKVRAHERDAVAAGNVVLFLSGMSKATTLALIDALKLSSHDYVRFENVARRNPEIGRAARWIRNWSGGMIQATRPLRADPELAKIFERCVANINRIAEQRERTKRRGSTGAG
jgi:hypothetical protein